jgi:hypothetical protein
MSKEFKTSEELKNGEKIDWKEPDSDDVPNPEMDNIPNSWFKVETVNGVNFEIVREAIGVYGGRYVIVFPQIKGRHPFGYDTRDPYNSVTLSGDGEGPNLVRSVRDFTIKTAKTEPDVRKVYEKVKAFVEDYEANKPDPF